MATRTPFSVLMSVYAAENPDFLHQSMGSIFAQTLPTDDFVLVCDGELTPELDSVIASFAMDYYSTLKVVKLSTNQGLAAALNFGLQHCKHDIVARMDSDDIAMPHRMETQLAQMAGVDILGSSVLEFTNHPTDANTIRNTPTTDDAIKKFARRRNPFSHPSVMFRKSTVLKAGGYENFPLCEDYQLWVKIFRNGGKGKNISDPLLYMRVGNGMYKRRGGFGYLRTMVKFRHWLLKTGFTSMSDFCISVASHIVSCFAPSCARKFMYHSLLRNKISEV